MRLIHEKRQQHERLHPTITAPTTSPTTALTAIVHYRPPHAPMIPSRCDKYPLKLSQANSFNAARPLPPILYLYV